MWSQAYSAQLEYDVFGNQTKVTQGAYLLTAGNAGYSAAKAALVRTQVATFTYDKMDRMLSATDGVGNRIAYVVDAFGNRTRQTTGDGPMPAGVSWLRQRRPGAHAPTVRELCSPSPDARWAIGASSPSVATPLPTCTIARET